VHNRRCMSTPHSADVVTRKRNARRGGNELKGERGQGWRIRRSNWITWGACPGVCRYRPMDQEPPDRTMKPVDHALGEGRTAERLACERVGWDLGPEPADGRPSASPAPWDHSATCRVNSTSLSVHGETNRQAEQKTMQCPSRSHPILQVSIVQISYQVAFFCTIAEAGKDAAIATWEIAT